MNIYIYIYIFSLEEKILLFLYYYYYYYMYTKAYKSNIYCLIYLKLIDLCTFYDFLKKYYYILICNI